MLIDIDTKSGFTEGENNEYEQSEKTDETLREMTLERDKYT